jgi:hypothetical protein
MGRDRDNRHEQRGKMEFIKEAAEERSDQIGQKDDG